MKHLLLAVSVAGFLVGVAALGQEKNADATVVAHPTIASVSVDSPSPQSPYSPSDIKILGTLNSGETSKLVQRSSTPPYRAFVFEGNGHDRVEITVKGADQKTFLALADATLTPIASGTGRLAATLPYHGPDKEAFYILFKSNGNQRAPVAVHLKKTSGSPRSPDATR